MPKKAKQKGSGPSDYDSPWKEVLERYLSEFMEFFFPSAHEDIDWSQGYGLLDKELKKVVRDAELGRRLVDKLVKVHLKAGAEQWVLVHIEVQGQEDEDLAERMYVYNYRLYDRYRRRVASLCVLADEDADWRPDRFGYALWGCEVAIRFPSVKLIDYGSRWEKLEESGSPFAIVVMAHLKAMGTRTDAEERYYWKLRLIRSLYTRGYGRDDILELFRFIDWIMVLPEAMEESLSIDIERLEKERKMPYVTSIERIGMKKGEQKGLRKGLEKGLEKGQQQGMAGLLKRLLVKRFGSLPDWAVERLSSAAPEQLECWAERVLQAKDLDEVFSDSLPEC